MGQSTTISEPGFSGSTLRGRGCETVTTLVLDWRSSRLSDGNPNVKLQRYREKVGWFTTKTLWGQRFLWSNWSLTKHLEIPLIRSISAPLSVLDGYSAFYKLYNAVWIVSPFPYIWKFQKATQDGLSIGYTKQIGSVVSRPIGNHKKPVNDRRPPPHRVRMELTAVPLKNNPDSVEVCWTLRGKNNMGSSNMMDNKNIGDLALPQSHLLRTVSLSRILTVPGVGGTPNLKSPMFRIPPRSRGAGCQSKFIDPLLRWVTTRCLISKGAIRSRVMVCFRWDVFWLEDWCWNTICIALLADLPVSSFDISIIFPVLAAKHQVLCGSKNRQRKNITGFVVRPVALCAVRANYWIIPSAVSQHLARPPSRWPSCHTL